MVAKYLTFQKPDSFEPKKTGLVWYLDVQVEACNF
jgi:hypothetical protein